MTETKTIIKRECSILPIALLVTIGFVIAKWCGTISWPWLVVLSPLWISLAAYAAILVVLGFLVILLAVAEAWVDA